MQFLYDVNLLYNQAEYDLQYANRVEFTLLLKRQAALLQLMNCGIEFTTLAQLNEIA